MILTPCQDMQAEYNGNFHHDPRSNMHGGSPLVLQSSTMIQDLKYDRSPPNSFTPILSQLGSSKPIIISKQLEHLPLGCPNYRGAKIFHIHYLHQPVTTTSAIS